MTNNDDFLDDVAIPLTDEQRKRFTAAAERGLKYRRERRSIIKGRRGHFVWHIYRPTKPTKFMRASFKRGHFSFSFRWVIGWVIW